jgi:prolyl-tRNA synthetase
MDYIDGITAELKAKGVRYHVDMRETLSPGFKFNDWEMKGAPLRLEVGPRDVDGGNLVSATRFTGEKTVMAKDEFLQGATAMLDDIQNAMLKNRKAFREENTTDISSYDELKAATVDGGFARAYWDGSREEEQHIQDECKATIRNIPFEQPEEEGVCFYTGKKTRQMVIFAKAY